MSKREVTAEQIKRHLERVLPRSCVALEARLRAWLEVAITSHSESAILASDGSLNDEAYALIQFARVFIEQVHLHAGATGDLLLLQARVGILNHVIAEMKEEGK